MRSPAPRGRKKNSDFGYERSKRSIYLTYENGYERSRRSTYLRGGPQECRRFDRARRTAARRHGLLPSTARSSTPASAHAPLWLCTWPSWARPCRHLQLRRRHACESNHSGLQQVRFLRKLMPGEGFCMHVLCYLLKTLERYAVPAAIATCCPGSIRALLASRLFSHVVLCSSVFRAYSSGVLHLPHGPY